MSFSVMSDEDIMLNFKNIISYYFTYLDIC